MNEMSMEMQRHAMDSWQVIKNRIGPIILSFLLVFACAAIITYIMPRKYRGEVRMKIERDAAKLKVNEASDRGDPGVWTDVFLKTEFETLTLSKTLDPVVTKLALAKAWNLPDNRAALGRLRANLEPQSSVKSDFFVIDFYDEDPKRAADVANAVAESYMTQRVAVGKEQKEKALTVLKRQITELEKQASLARTKASQAKQDAGVVAEMYSNGPFARQGGQSVVSSEEGGEAMRGGEEYRLKASVLGFQADLDQLSKLTPDELISRAPGLKIQNTNITSLTQEMQKAQIEREGQLAIGCGRKHPKVKALDDQIEKTREIILTEANNYIAGLRSSLESNQKQLAAVEKFNEEKRQGIYDKNPKLDLYLAAKRDLETVEDLLAKNRQSYLTSEADMELEKSPATIWQPADIETTPAKPRVFLNLSLGAIVGLMFGLGLAFALEYLDTSVKTLDDVERYLGVPVLAVVPQNVGVLHRTAGFNPDAEAYRILRTNIEFNRHDANANCITVVSGGAGEGKSTTLTNLAFVCAQGGYNVLLIDADLRRPRLHTLFDTSNAVGLTNYLTTDVQLEDVVLKTPVDNLYFLPSGVLPADGAGILNSQRMSDLITDVKSRFDLVLIDSPPILGVSDASVLANEADMTIIVVQHRKLPRQMLMRVKQAVDSVGGNVLGVVLNNVDVKSDSAYSYYTSYYTYYAPSNLPNGAPEKRKRKKQNSTSAALATPSSGRSNRDAEDIF